MIINYLIFLLPILFTIILCVIYGFEETPNKITIVGLALSGFIPIINIAIIVMVIAVIVIQLRTYEIHLRDNKFNRFWFANYFKK